MEINIYKPNCKISEKDIEDQCNKVISFLASYRDSSKPDLNTIELVINVYSEDEMIEECGSLTRWRAYQGSNRINIFDTRYETHKSLCWIFIHEFIHHIQKEINPTIKYFMRALEHIYFSNEGLDIKDRQKYFLVDGYSEMYERDEIREYTPMESMSNMFATYLVGEDMSRPWWRDNIKKILKEGQYEVN